MRQTGFALIAAAAMAAAGLTAGRVQAQGNTERYGLGMFKAGERSFAGLAMRYPTEPQQVGGLVVELPAAAAAAGQTGIPGDVMSMIEAWDSIGPRIRQIVADVGRRLDEGSRPAYVHEYTSVDVLAPLVPRMAMYGFGNYRNVLNAPEPVKPQPPAPSIPGLWERDPRDTRPVNPRIFMIPNTPEVFIGDGEPVIVWHADRRAQYEYECELLAIVGRPMRRVPVDQVKNYIFGYTNTNDISDRFGRGEDVWVNDPLLRKGKDSSKPIGPFIVPAEFVDPLTMRLKMTVGGVLVQDSDTTGAWHSVYEYGAYLSNLITVPVGTVIGLGTPPGSHGGLGRFMQEGDLQVCSYEGLGTLTNPVKGEGAPARSTID